MKKTIPFIILAFSIKALGGAQPYKALVVVPVADLVGQPLLAQGQQNVYNLPISGVGKNGCCRVHQMIFNEMVTVLEEQGDEIRVSLPNIFFEQANNKKRFTEYWTNKHTVVPLDKLKQKNISLAFIPEPIEFGKKPEQESTQQIVTLLYPHYDPLTQNTYSAGTRFVISKITKNNQVMVVAYSKKHDKLRKITLPQHVCLLNKPKTRKEQIALFTTLVQQWAHQQHGFIPYVLGGCSFTTTCRTDKFVKKDNAYYRPTHPHAPAPGLDCTGIIARATQICGIPYYFKNSTTLVKYLRPITTQEKIESGDIIWFSGHAIIIADASKNTCVEARSYDHGFGKIHALPIDRLFANTKNLEDIKTAMLEKKQLTRLDSKGNGVQKIHTIKILKLESVWPSQQQKHRA